MTTAHMHISKLKSGDHTIKVCHPTYTKSEIGSISQVHMEPAENEEGRILYVADGQDYSSSKPGYQPMSLGTYSTPDKAQEAIRMHAYYSSPSDSLDPDLFQEAKVKVDEAVETILNLIKSRVDSAQNQESPLRAEDVNKTSTEETRPLPAELAQALANAPQELIDQIMALNDVGAIGGVSIIEIKMGDD